MARRGFHMGEYKPDKSQTAQEFIEQYRKEYLAKTNGVDIGGRVLHDDELKPPTPRPKEWAAKRQEEKNRVDKKMLGDRLKQTERRREELTRKYNKGEITTEEYEHGMENLDKLDRAAINRYG